MAYVSATVTCSEDPEEIALDAKRWKALVSSARIRVAGRDIDYLWLEFWTSHEVQDNHEANELLKKHVDSIIGCEDVHDSDDRWLHLRWQALLRSPLLNLIGFAGFDVDCISDALKVHGRPSVEFLHMGLEIGHDLKDSVMLPSDRGSELVCAVLTAYADWVIEHRPLGMYTVDFTIGDLDFGRLDYNYTAAVSHDDVYAIVENAARAIYGTQYDEAPENGDDEYPGDCRRGMREDAKDALLSLGVGLVGLVRLKRLSGEWSAANERMSDRA